MHTCTYSHTYTDVLTGDDRAYQCPRQRWRNKSRCILHASGGGVDDGEARDVFLDELRCGSAEGGDDPMLFVGCRIPSVTVRDIDTRRPVCFADARLAGDVEFNGVTCGAIDFTEAEFSGRLSMTATRAGVLSLRKAGFGIGGSAGHSDAGEDGDGGAAVRLERCDFESCDAALASAPSASLVDCEIGSAMLRYAKVGSLAVRDCTFGRRADFADSTLGDAVFNGVSFGGETVFEDGRGGTVFEGPARFRHTRFDREERIRFGRSLSNVSFLTTNMTRIRFRSDTVWNAAGDPYAILDERRLADDLQSSSLSDILAVYRSLRECYEYWLMYEEAGRLYAREMDMRRRYRTDARGGLVRRSRWYRYLSLTNGYNVLCRYGESFRRASAWVGCVFAASTSYYALCGDLGMVDPQGDYAARAAAAVERTLAAFLHTSRDGMADHLVRIASLPVLGSMFIVLKRRLERRLRH